MVFLFGSFLKGGSENANDVDLAVVILKDMEPSDRTLFWMDNHSKWKKDLSEKIRKPVDLQLYEPGHSSQLRKYLLEASKLIYAA